MNKKLKFWNCGASIDVTTNKFIEFEFIIDKDFSNYFEYTIKWSRKGDHAGFRYSIGLFKFFFEFNFADKRHWNWDENRWFEPKEELINSHPVIITDYS